MDGILQPMITDILLEEVPEGFAVVVEIFDDEALVRKRDLIESTVIDREVSIPSRNLIGVIISLCAPERLVSVDDCSEVQRVLSVKNEIVIYYFKHLCEDLLRLSDLGVQNLADLFRQFFHVLPRCAVNIDYVVPECQR